MGTTKNPRSLGDPGTRCIVKKGGTFPFQEREDKKENQLKPTK